VTKPVADVTPRRLAAAARALQPTLFDALALAADSLEDELAERFFMVPWDRVRLIGQAQGVLTRLGERRFAADELGGPLRHVIERRALPLESIGDAWTELRAGRRVVVSGEAGSCQGALELLRRMGEVLGGRLLTVVESATDVPPEAVATEPAWAGPRIALVQPDADPETAAYVLGRTSLRRTGFDPRAVHHAVVAGPSARLERVLRRIWLGARMGAISDETAFAGPVGPGAATAYLDALAAWAEHPGVRTVVEGGPLRRPDADEHRRYLAPALFVLERAEVGPAPTVVGPMLILEPCEAGEADDRLRRLNPPTRRGTVLRFGEPRRGMVLNPFDRQVRGALLVERLPPGLPDPRP
jgi:hypothetical protein